MTYAKHITKTVAATFKMLGVNDDAHTCECCGKTNLKRVVTLENLSTGEIVRYGVDCAAKAMKVKASIVKGQSNAVATAQIWLAKGFTAEVVARGLWDKFGYSTAVKSGKIIIQGVGEVTLMKTLTADQIAILTDAAQGFGREIAINNTVTKDVILGAYSDFIFFFDTDIELDVLKAHEDFIVNQIAIGTQL